MKTAPVLFVSHGSPMFAVEPGLLGPRLIELGHSLQDVKAILVVSAHWQTRGVHVSTAPQPETIHDFGGFPAQLYQLTYPAVGAPQIARDAAELLTTAGFNVRIDGQRGLDHGAWVPMRYLRADAGVPVFQVSMPHDLDAVGAVRLGHALAPLREQGVMIVGSGSLTHNLSDFFGGGSGSHYAQEFVDWIRRAVESRDMSSLTAYRKQAPAASRAHPTEEHFLPLLVAAGASSPAESIEILEGGMTHGVLSMDSFVWGRLTLADDRSTAA
jgi:4,5-DOPA dioxygenase extradiol